MSAELLGDLARAKAAFQLRAIVSVLTGFRPNVAYLGPHDLDPATYECRGCREALFDLARHQDRPCAKGLWPLSVAVPRRVVPGVRNAPEGTAEGDLCLRSHSGLSPCLGKLWLRPLDGSACFCGATRAPCSSCLSWAPECSRCGHREDEA